MGEAGHSPHFPPYRQLSLEILAADVHADRCDEQARQREYWYEYHGGDKIDNHDQKGTLDTFIPPHELPVNRIDVESHSLDDAGNGRLVKPSK